MKPGNHRKSDGANSCRTIVLGDKRDAVQQGHLPLGGVLFYQLGTPTAGTARVSQPDDSDSCLRRT